MYNIPSIKIWTKVTFLDSNGYSGYTEMVKETFQNKSSREKLNELSLSLFCEMASCHEYSELNIVEISRVIIHTGAKI